jgi:GGDEF domain-containing protein
MSLEQKLKGLADRISGKKLRELETQLSKANEIIDGDESTILDAYEQIREAEHRLEELEKENALLKKDVTDDLTGFPQSGYFRRKFDAAIMAYLTDRNNYFVLVDTDLAGMKHANKLGYATVGDKLIEIQAGIIRSYTEKVVPHTMTRRETIARSRENYEDENEPGRRGGDELSLLLTGKEEVVVNRANEAKQHIYDRQAFHNNRPEKEKVIPGGMELCIGVAIVSAKDIPDKYLEGAPTKENVALIRDFLLDKASKGTTLDKIAQGIYERHQEYSR